MLRPLGTFMVFMICQVEHGEYVMGNMVDSSGNFNLGSSGLSKPDTKYYDSYAYSASTYTDHARSHWVMQQRKL